MIEREGMMTKTARSGVTHMHPAVKVERESRAQFAKIWTSLGLNWDMRVDGGSGSALGFVGRSLEPETE